jgi:proton glutamate symport protein
VLLAAAKEIGLPAEGVALLLAVDFFVDMGRSALNVVGNSLATVVIAKSEKSFHFNAEDK